MAVLTVGMYRQKQRRCLSSYHLLHCDTIHASSKWQQQAPELAHTKRQYTPSGNLLPAHLLSINRWLLLHSYHSRSHCWPTWPEAHVERRAKRARRRATAVVAWRRWAQAPLVEAAVVWGRSPPVIFPKVRSRRRPTSVEVSAVTPGHVGAAIDACPRPALDRLRLRARRVAGRA